MILSPPPVDPVVPAQHRATHRQRANRASVLALVAEAYGGHGGIAQSTRDLLEALRVLPRVGAVHCLPRHVRANAEPPAGITQGPPCASRWAFSRRALRTALADSPDLVYCGHAFMAPLAWLIARMQGARLVVHLHGLELWEPLGPSVKAALASADRLLCVSRHTVEMAVQRCGVDPARCAVVYNTFHTRFFPALDGHYQRAARQRLDLAPEARVLSTVSRLDPRQRHKGHDRVIPRLGVLAKQHPGLVYLIAGTGGDEARLRTLVQETDAEDIVRFLGSVPAEDLPDVYRASDLFVMPSHGEGFGIAFLEAMACGTPALGLDVGGAGDALCDGTLGRAVREADFPAALGDALNGAMPMRGVPLALRTRAHFGASMFRARVAEAITPLLSSPVQARKASKT
ncbi:MAG: glycosyltransferase family 4 protein [Pseudomonadota bacterium]